MTSPEVRVFPRPAVKSSWIKHAVLEGLAPPGAYAEFGLYKGETFAKVAPTFHARGDVCVGFDSFEGLVGVTSVDGSDRRANPNRFRAPDGTYSRLVRDHPNDLIVAGDVRKTAWSFMRDTDLMFSFVLLDMDIYEPTKAALKALVKYDRLVDGAVILADDYFLRHYPGEKKACHAVLGAAGWEKVYSGAAAFIYERGRK